MRREGRREVGMERGRGERWREIGREGGRQTGRVMEEERAGGREGEKERDPSWPSENSFPTCSSN